MTITETLLNSHRFTNALFTKIASTLSQKPLLKKGAFCYPPFPGIPSPLFTGMLFGPSRSLPGAFSGFFSRFLRFPQKATGPVFYRPAFRTDPEYPGLPSGANRPPAGNRRQPVMKKPFARIFANTPKTRAQGSAFTKRRQAPAPA